MFRERNKKAQGTLEYVIILTAIVGLIIYAAATWIKPAVDRALQDAHTTIGKAAEKIK